MKTFLVLADRLLWPSLPIKILWLILVTAVLFSAFVPQATLVILPLSCLLLLIFCIPLQFMQLRHKRSWLLLPYFKQQSRLLLLIVTLLVGILSGSLMLILGHSFWLAFQFGALAFAVLILPCLLFGNLRPLLFNSALLVVLFGSDVLNWQPDVSPLMLAVVLAAINTLLLSWFCLNWLKPGTTKAVANDSQQSKNWLRQFTRKPATLSGSLLLGQGDSWQARTLRSVAYCWYLPGFMLVWSIFFSSGSFPQQHFLRAMFIVFPGFLLIDHLSNMLRRVRRAWLQLAGTRQQLFCQLERQALKELLVTAIVITPLIIWLLPTAAALTMLLLVWPGLMLCSLYLSWRLINVSVFWSGSALITLNILTIAAVVVCWHQPYYLVIYALVLISLATILRQQVRQRFHLQDWARLKLLQPPKLRTGL